MVNSSKQIVRRLSRSWNALRRHDPRWGAARTCLLQQTSHRMATQTDQGAVMSIDTQQAITGFIATEPRLTYTEDGTARFYARIGIEHSQQTPDGSFTQLDPSFHDMSAFRRAAEEGVARFHKGDKFIATGRVREYSYEKDGQTVAAEEFIVSRFGHDVARTQYEVDRGPHRDSNMREATGRDASPFEAPARARAQSDAAPAVSI
jgi:single-strand DNA-binding protein